MQRSDKLMRNASIFSFRTRAICIHIYIPLSPEYAHISMKRLLSIVTRRMQLWLTTHVPGLPVISFNQVR